MTYDDGILDIYRNTNSAENGRMPVMTETLLSSHYFGFETVGVQRYFTAQMAHQQIDYVVHIPGWWDIIVTDTVKIRDGVSFHEAPDYRVTMVQQTQDNDGLKITRLSLERVKGG